MGGPGDGDQRGRDHCGHIDDPAGLKSLIGSLKETGNGIGRFLVQNAEEEGVVFEWLSAPKGFITEPGEDAAHVTGVTVQKMRLGAPDATGRQTPELIEGSDYVEDADLVIKALGFEPEDLPDMFGEQDLAVTRWGTIKAEFTTGKTALPGVYAVGDIVRGASLVVWAIRDGRDCADAILAEFGVTSAIAAE